MTGEHEVRFKSGDVELSGTLALPVSGKPLPVVLLLPGSGQTDRNENTKKYRLNVLGDISRHLYLNGIASFRYDKRGIGRSGGNYWATGFHDRTADARAAFEWLKLQKEIQPDSIFILGHSEGSLITTRLAGSGAEVAGIILLSGAAQTGEAILKWQAVQIANGLRGINRWLIKTFHIDVLKAQQKQFEIVKKSKKDWYRQQLIVRINAKWLREFMAYNPTDDLARISQPVLAITGSKDIQVDPADLELMAQIVKSPFEYHLIENMTHILRLEEGDASISNYSKEMKRPIEPMLLGIILHWIRNRIGLADGTSGVIIK